MIKQIAQEINHSYFSTTSKLLAELKWSKSYRINLESLRYITLIHIILRYEILWKFVICYVNSFELYWSVKKLINHENNSAII